MSSKSVHSGFKSIPVLILRNDVSILLQSTHHIQWQPYVVRHCPRCLAPIVYKIYTCANGDGKCCIQLDGHDDSCPWSGLPLRRSSTRGARHMSRRSSSTSHRSPLSIVAMPWSCLRVGMLVLGPPFPRADAGCIVPSVLGQSVYPACVR